MTSNREDGSVKDLEREQPRKAYSTPAMEIHGSVADITRGAAAGYADELGGSAAGV